MPYVNIKITKENGPEGRGPSKEEKALIIKGVTELLESVLKKNPATTFITIEEIELCNWGVGGFPVSEYRARNSHSTSVNNA